MALSYVWGNASIKEQLLFQFDHTEGVGHYALDISINLASALRRLRSRTSFDWASKTCLVWADAVCVNQGSVQERSQQVQIMHQIYAAATSVWVYPTDVSATYWKRRKPIGQHTMFTMSLRHKAFFSEAYWTRAWVVQELFFAREIWIMYEDKEAPCDLKAWKPGTPLLTGLGFFGQPPKHLQSEVYQLKRIKYSELVEPSVGESHLLYNLLWQCRYRRATLPQDKIYSLMNILPGCTSILQDYNKDAASVYGEFMKQVIAQGPSYIPCRPLDFLKPTHNITSPHTPGLPTWCPDFCEHADTVDILENVCATHSPSTVLRRPKTAQLQGQDYQPWFHMRLRYRSDGQDSEPSPRSGIISIRAWDLPYTPLSCVATNLDTNEPPAELIIKGIRLDRLTQLGENLRLNPTNFTLVMSVEEALATWKHLATGIYRPTLESSALAFLKILLVNSSLSDSKQATAASILKHHVFGAQTFPTVPSTRGLDDYLSELKACLPGWRFAVTSKKYYAKVPNLAEPGDVVCVPLGSSTPLLLRQVGGKFQLVGRCFVQGYMNGEAMAGLNQLCQGYLDGKSKSELSDEHWQSLKGLVDRELKSFTLI